MPALFWFQLQRPQPRRVGRRKNKGPGVPLLVDSKDIYLVCRCTEKNTDSTLLCSIAKNIFFFNLKQSCVYPQWAGRVVSEGLKKSWKQGWGEQNNKKAVAAEFRRLNSRAPITGTREQRHDVIRGKLFKYIYLFFPWNASTQTRIRINFIFQACTCKMRNLILLCLYPGVQWFGEKKEEKDNSRESTTIEKIKQNRAWKK